MRLIGVAAAVAIVAGGLTACKSNVGLAASVGSSRITESAVTSYLTQDAAAYTQTDPTTNESSTINPKSDVLGLIIADKLFTAVFKTVPGGLPTTSEMDTARAGILSQIGMSADAFAQSEAKEGYKASYTTYFVDVHAKFAILEDRLNDTAGDGSALLAAIDKTHLSVRVNPRYGTWQAQQLTVSTGPDVPSYFTFIGDGADASDTSGSSDTSTGTGS